MSDSQQHDDLSTAGHSTDKTTSDSEKLRGRYVVLTFRIPKWLLYAFAFVPVISYVAALYWTGYSRQLLIDPNKPPKSYESKLVKYGCIDKLRNEYNVPNEFGRNLARRRVFWLDDSRIGYNGMGIIDDPLCLGARLSDLMHTPGTARYYVVDPNSKTVLLEVIKREY